MEDGLRRRDFFPLLDLPGFPSGASVRRILLVGRRPEELALYLAALAASRGFQVRVADGANTFDPYVISRFARREGFLPELLLKRIFLARAFTCHQLVTLVGERLGINPEAPPLVVLLGPCTLFFDEDVPGPEAALLFRRMLARVQEMSRRGVFFLMSQSPSGGRGRKFLLPELARLAEAVLQLEASAETLQVRLKKPPGALPGPWEVFEDFKALAVC